MYGLCYLCYREKQCRWLDDIDDWAIYTPQKPQCQNLMYEMGFCRKHWKTIQQRERSRKKLRRKPRRNPQIRNSSNTRDAHIVRVTCLTQENPVDTPVEIHIDHTVCDGIIPGRNRLTNVDPKLLPLIPNQIRGS